MKLVFWIGLITTVCSSGPFVADDVRGYVAGVGAAVAGFAFHELTKRPGGGDD